MFASLSQKQRRKRRRMVHIIISVNCWSAISNSRIQKIFEIFQRWGGMDLLFTYLFHFILICSPIYLIFILFRRKSSFNTKLPPGRTGWPVIGETLEFGKAGRRGHPEQFVTDRMRKFSPDVFRTCLVGDSLLVFCGASGNKFLFSTEHVTNWWPRSIEKLFQFPANSFKEEVSIIRSFLPEFLRPEGLQNFIPIMDSMTREHFEAEWSPQIEVKVFPFSKKYTFALACRLFVSIKDPKHVARLAEAFALVSTGLISLPIDFPGTAFHRAIQGAKIIHEELLAIVKRRKKELLENNQLPAAVDILTRMLLASHEKIGRSLNEKEIARKIFALLVASRDTTSGAITATVYFLAGYPHIYEKVLKEQMEIAKAKAPGELLNWDDIQKMKYSWCVVREAMRLAPPSPGAYREVISDFTFAGFTIPTGSKIYWDANSTHKNPLYYQDPEKFDPSRFEGNGPAPYTFVPFGGGHHKCPGIEYARTEILVFMHNLMTKFKLEKVIPDEKFMYNPFPVPVHGLPVRLESHPHQVS